MLPPPLAIRLGIGSVVELDLLFYGCSQSFHVADSPACAETEVEMIARGRYIAGAIQGCGCHTRERPDGSKDDNWHFAVSPNPRRLRSDGKRGLFFAPVEEDLYE